MLVKDKALALGFDDVGITKAQIPQADIDAYESWLESGKHGELEYMEKRMRCSPQELLPGAKTAIICVSYYKKDKSEQPETGKVASYAWGRDYHNVHHRRLKKLIRYIEDHSGLKGCCKAFSDSAPILERALAVQAGLGWFGKNTLLIHRRFGTFTLLSGILTTLDLENPTIKDERMPRCGSCTSCLDACPTGALKPYELDANLCLSYHLIEAKNPIPEKIQRQNPGYAFGCDICQDACPHNVRKPPSDTEDFQSHKGLGSFLDLSLIEELEQKPEKLFGTPLKRRGVQGLRWNTESVYEQC
jgi:epoxyqueuosine reductase